MCQIRQAQKHQFQEWELQVTGHGHYCVWPDGYVVSHSDASINCQQRSSKFKTGDVLHFEYNSAEGNFTVVNNNRGHFKMNVPKGKGEKYAACVYLWHKGDFSELLSC